MKGGAFGYAKPTPKPSPPASEAPPPKRVRDPAAELASLASARVPPPPKMEDLPKPAKFVPGKPGEPRSGARATELLKDPVTLERLMEEISAWEKENPGRKLLGPTVKSMLPEVSDAQARTIAKRINRAKAQMMRS